MSDNPKSKMQNPKFEHQRHKPPTVLTRSRDAADYFESCVELAGGDAKTVANWINGELAATLNREDVGIASGPVSRGLIGAFLGLLLGVERLPVVPRGREA